MGMKTITAAKFKAQCLSLFDHLDPEGLVVTKRGKAVARVIPMTRPSADLIGALRGQIKFTGDVTSTGLRWNAGN